MSHSHPPVPRNLVAPARRAAFTLVEMLVVMAVIVVILAVTRPVMTSLSGAGDVNKAIYDISGILEQARAYAMSNNTYVYVGFQEADANSSASGPQSAGVGRVSVAAFARTDGTRGYDVNNPTASWKGSYGTGANFLTIGKVQRFSNLHLLNLGTPPSGGGMARGPYLNGQPASVDAAYNLADTSCTPVTPFEYPLGNAAGKGDCTFAKVIQFDPQGVARIQEERNADTIVKLVEIGLVQTHGSAAPTPPMPAVSGPIAAIQIDCMAGSTHIYRP